MEVRWPTARKRKPTRGPSVKHKDPAKSQAEKVMVKVMDTGTDASIALKHIDAGFNSVFGTEGNKLIYKGQDWFLSSGNPNRQ